MEKLIKSIKDFFKPDHRFTQRTEKEVLNTAAPLQPPPPLEFDFSGMSENSKKLYRLVELENNLKKLLENSRVLGSIESNSPYARITIEYRSPFGRGTVWVNDNNLKAVTDIAISSINTEIA